MSRETLQQIHENLIEIRDMHSWTMSDPHQKKVWELSTDCIYAIESEMSKLTIAPDA